MMRRLAYHAPSRFGGGHCCFPFEAVERPGAFLLVDSASGDPYDNRMWRWIFKAPLGLSLPSAFQNEVPSRVASAEGPLAAATQRAGPLSSCSKTVYGSSRRGPARPEGYFETCSKGLLRL